MADSEYDASMKASLTFAEIEAIQITLAHMDVLPPLTDFVFLSGGVLTLSAQDDSEPFAEIWRDPESESWLVKVLRGKASA